MSKKKVNGYTKTKEVMAVAKRKKKVRRTGAGNPEGALPVGGMPGFNPSQLLAQVQKLQEEMLAAQEALKEEIIEVSVGGGVVTVRMTAAQEVVSVEIDPEVVDPEDVEMLQDLLVAAFNEALAKARAVTEARMAPFTTLIEGSGLGGLLGR
ncbi:MAG: YbaB/EbfC family nucleoid-associated protein [Ardenticatenia bacterium]|nr:YbaB/EbfC family nucleoid-associated protein [Ardenticatenia bacterium]